jgi:hypothetical protein
MPGELVTARLREEKKSFALADLVSVDKPHPQRIQPRCTHFGTCGGCHYQHIPYECNWNISGKYSANSCNVSQALPIQGRKRHRFGGKLAVP